MREQLSRRDLIKTILVTSAASIIENKLWAAKTVSEVAPVAALTPAFATARVNLAAFPALNNNNGSVRLGSSGISNGFPLGLFWPILINRISATEYVVLDSACTHAGCIVPAFSGGRIFCDVSTNNCGHGSRYDIQGNVLEGPAGSPLLKYNSTLDSVNRILSISLPGADGWTFNTVQTLVLNGAEQRLELKWESFAGVEYEVRFRPNFATEPTVINFATTLSGPMTTAFITGNNRPETDPNARKAYVPAQDGFYQIAIRFRQV